MMKKKTISVPDQHPHGALATTWGGRNSVVPEPFFYGPPLKTGKLVWKLTAIAMPETLVEGTLEMAA